MKRECAENLAAANNSRLLGMVGAFSLPSIELVSNFVYNCV